MHMTQHAWGDFKAKLIFKKKKLHCRYLGFTSQVYDAAKLKCILCLPIVESMRSDCPVEHMRLLDVALASSWLYREKGKLS